MATQGPLYPGTVEQFANPPESAEAWVNPGNVSADDGTSATITAATYDTGDFSNILLPRNFGFSIPAGATIDGIVVEIDREINAGAARDGRVQLRAPSGAFVGDSKATATAWPANLEIATYGGAADNWNAGMSDTDVNHAEFGVLLSVEATSNNTDIAVDFVRMTVHYTEADDGSATGSGAPTKTLSSSASGAATLSFNGSGSPTKTLAASAVGEAANSDVVGSGTPTKTLSTSAAGAATQSFSGTGSPTKTLSLSAAGAATQAFTGSGAPSKTLASSAAGTATNTVDNSVTGSGAPTAVLSISAESAATRTLNDSSGSGTPSKTLSSSAAGAGTQTISGSGAPSKTLSSSAAGTATRVLNDSSGSGTPAKTLSSSASGAAENDSPLPPQIARPVADLFVSGWEEDDGSTDDLFDQIDETSRDDDDYIQTVPGPSGAVAVFRLSPFALPSEQEGFILRYVAGKHLTGGHSINITVQLRQSYVNEGSPGTLLDQWVELDVDSLTLLERNVSAAVAAQITNFSEVDVRLVADQINNIFGVASPVESLSASATGVATRSAEGQTFFSANAESGTMIPPWPSWGVVQFNGTVTNSTTLAKNGSRSWRYDVTTPGFETIAHDCVTLVATPHSSMGGPTGKFMSGFYSFWAYIDAGYTTPGEQTGWNLTFGWMTGVDGSPQPICNVGIEHRNGIIQMMFQSKTAAIGLYTPPTIPDYTQGSPGWYYMTAQSPNGITPFPTGQWVHVCLEFVMARANGRVTIWQDGTLIMDMTAPTLNTFDGTQGLTNEAGDVLLQMGIYGGHQEAPLPRLYLDDIRVTDFRVVP